MATITPTPTNTTVLKAAGTAAVRGAQAFGTIFNATSDSVDMFGQFISEHSTRQQAKHAAEREIYLEQLQHDTALSLANINVEAETFCAKSADHRKLYDASAQRSSEILAKFRA